MLNKNLFSALLVIVVAVSSFLAFEPLFKTLTDSTAQQFTSAIFGSIFASILTMFLLNKQTEIEEQKQKNQRVFEEKVTLFKEIIEALKDIFDDRLITIDEMGKIEFLLIKLTMLAEDQTIKKFQELYQYLVSDERERNEDGAAIIDSIAFKGKDGQNILLQFTSLCRQELGLAENAYNEGLFVSLNETILRSEKLQKYRTFLDNLDLLMERTECSDEEQLACVNTIDQIVELARIARRDGLLELDEVKINPDYLRNWIKFVTDGTDLPIVDDLNKKEIIRGHYSGKELLERVISYQGVLLIQEGYNPRIIQEKLLVFLKENIRNSIKEEQKKEELKFEEEKQIKLEKDIEDIEKQIEDNTIFTKDTGKLDFLIKLIPSPDSDYTSKHEDLFLAALKSILENDIIKALKYSNKNVFNRISNKLIETSPYWEKNTRLLKKLDFLNKITENCNEEDALRAQDKIIQFIQQIQNIKVE